MTTCNLKSGHQTRTIGIDPFADGQTPGRTPLRISDGTNSITLHFTEAEITERGPEVAALLDTALNCYIGRMKPPAEMEQPEAHARPFLVGPLSAVPDAACESQAPVRKPGE